MMDSAAADPQPDDVTLPRSGLMLAVARSSRRRCSAPVHLAGESLRPAPGQLATTTIAQILHRPLACRRGRDAGVARRPHPVGEASVIRRLMRNPPGHSGNVGVSSGASARRVLARSRFISTFIAAGFRRAAGELCGDRGPSG